MPVHLHALANDTNLANGRLFFHIVSGPAHGVIGIDTRGTPEDSSDDVLTYWPDRHFSGADSFVYSITDAFGQSSSATVEITVTAINQAPAAGIVSAATSLESPVTVNVLDSAFDPEEDTLEVLSATNGQHGTTSVNLDGSISYTPDEGFRVPGQRSKQVEVQKEQGSAIWPKTRLSRWADGSPGWR